jgi:hypothetical protein
MKMTEDLLILRFLGMRKRPFIECGAGVATRFPPRACKNSYGRKINGRLIASGASGTALKILKA